MATRRSWVELAAEVNRIKQSGESLRALWWAYEGHEEHGVWLLVQGKDGTQEAVADFGLFAAQAIAKLGIAPVPIPTATEHDPQWELYCKTEEELARLEGRETDLSAAVPYGLGEIDRDAVDPCTRAWLELLRRSGVFQPSEGWRSIKGESCRTFDGIIDDVYGASATFCKRYARDDVGLIKPASAIEEASPEHVAQPEEKPNDKTSPLVDAAPSGKAANDPQSPTLWEKLSLDDPNYEVVRRFSLESWADSYGLVADGYAGRVSLPEFVEKCLTSFKRGADVHVAIEDSVSLAEKCSQLDEMAAKCIRQFNESLKAESEHLGDDDSAGAVAEFSRGVNEITSRSKQQIYQRELLMSSAPPPGLTTKPVTFTGATKPPSRRNRLITKQFASERVIDIRAPKMAYSFPETFPRSMRAKVMAARLRAEESLLEKKTSITEFADAESLLFSFRRRAKS